MPTLPRLITTIVHSTQTLKPRFSAKIEKIRFLRAIALPVASQKRLVLGLPVVDPAASGDAVPRASTSLLRFAVVQAAASPSYAGVFRRSTTSGRNLRRPTRDAPVEAEPARFRKQTAHMSRPRANLDVAALADAFAADGLHGTSSAALAAGAGVAKPTLYAHGGSKEALFLRAVEAEVERVLSRLHAAEARTVGRAPAIARPPSPRALLDHAAARPDWARGCCVTRPTATGRRRGPSRRRCGASRSASRPGCAATSPPTIDPDRPPLARALHGAATAVGLALDPPSTARPALAALAAAVVPLPAAATPWPAA